MTTQMKLPCVLQQVGTTGGPKGHYTESITNKFLLLVAQKLKYWRSSSCTPTLWNALEMSAVTAKWLLLKSTNLSNKRVVKDGPLRRQSFNDYVVAILLDVLYTILNGVVSDCLATKWCGRK